MTTQQTQTIADFVLERVAEDEAVAKAVIDEGGYTTSPDGRWRFEEIPYEGEWPRNPEADVAMWADSEWTAHVNRHDPARVLAQCAAHRAIVAGGPSECGGYADQDDFGWKHYPDPDYAGHCDGCSAAEACDSDWRRNLRALAAIWSDAPGYRSEWAL